MRNGAERVVSMISAARGVHEAVIARPKSFDCMFAARSASVLPPRAVQPNVVDIQYRGKLGWSGGESGKSGN